MVRRNTRLTKSYDFSGSTTAQPPELQNNIITSAPLRPVQYFPLPFTFPFPSFGGSTYNNLNEHQSYRRSDGWEGLLFVGAEDAVAERRAAAQN